MKYIFWIVIIYIILLCLEYGLYKYINNNKPFLFTSKKQISIIKNNNDPEKTAILDDAIKNTLNERVDLLETMEFNEWIEYNKKNMFVKYNDEEFYIFIYENTNFDDHFTLRCTAVPELLDLNYSTANKLISQKYVILQMFPPIENLPQEMYNKGLSTDGFGTIYYNWEDPLEKRPVKKKAIYTKYKKDDFDGVISIGYTVEDLDVTLGEIYFNIASKPILIILHLLIFIIPVVLYFLEYKGFTQFLISSSIVVSGWVLLVYQLFSPTTLTNISIENNRTQQISSRILGISFLIGVNIFIIGLLGKSFHKARDEAIKFKKQILFLFIVVVMCLLVSLFSFNNHLDIYSYRSLRIDCQLFFNFSIFYNLVMCCLFIYFFFKNSAKYSIYKLIKGMNQ